MAGEKKDFVELDWDLTDLSNDLRASGHTDIASLLLEVRQQFRDKEGPT